MDPVMQALPALAAALLVSLALGRTFARFGVPRVTVYLLVGLLLGPHIALQWIDPDGAAGRLLLGEATGGPLDVAKRLAIGFILFGIGGEFRLAELRRMGPRVLAVAGGEIGAVALLVGAAVWLGTGDWRLAVIAPALAVASAPSATLVTLREVEAEGPASRTLILCVGLDNLAALLAFPLLLAIAFGGGGAGAALGLAGVAVLGGLLLGLLAAVSLEVIAGRRELVLLGLLVVLAALGGAHALAPDSTGLGMLACFGAGLALTNGSPHAHSLFRYLENTVYPLYVLFFIAAGRELEIATVAALGTLGVLFLAARTGGKLLGSWAGLRLAGWHADLPGSLGAGLLCQAGIALGLVAALEASAPEATAGLRQVVIASVVVFELVGPWLLRSTAVRAGEVKLVNLMPRGEARGPDALRWVWLELRRNLGLLKATGRDGSRATVRHVMHRRPRTVSEQLSFPRLLKVLGEGGPELIPVLDTDGRFRGAISYEEVKHALYDPLLQDLVIAGDLTEDVPDPLEPDDSLPTALERMDRHGVHAWPVVDGDRLMGLVTRPDVYSLLRRGLRQRAVENLTPSIDRSKIQP